VQQHDGRTGALISNVKREAVGLDQS
jgi:hypothetical protein